MIFATIYLRRINMFEHAFVALLCISFYSVEESVSLFLVSSYLLFTFQDILLQLLWSVIVVSLITTFLLLFHKRHSRNYGRMMTRVLSIVDGYPPVRKFLRSILPLTVSVMRDQRVIRTWRSLRWLKDKSIRRIPFDRIVDRLYPYIYRDTESILSKQE